MASQSEPLAKVSNGLGAPLVSVGPPPLPVRPPAAPERDFTDPLSGLLLDAPSNPAPPPAPQAPAPLPTAVPSTLVAPARPVEVSPPKATPKTLMDYVDEFMASSAAELPSPESISSSVGGLRLLARMRAWAKVASLAQQLLTERGGSSSPSEEACDEVHVYYYFALLKLGRPPFAGLRTQLDAFMASRTNAATNSRWMVALELLQLELLQYSEGPGSQEACLDGLGRLQRRLNDHANYKNNVDSGADGASSHPVMTSGEARLWARRVTMSICNAAVRTSKWRVALVALESLRPSSSSGDSDELGPLEVSLQVEMLSRIGKVFLQMGQLEEASNFLAQAAATGEGHKNTTARITLNNGLVAFARSDFRTAMQLFQEVMALERGRAVDLADYGADLIGVDVEETLLIEAVNNYAIAAMYTCELQEAVSTLEKLIQEDPAAHLVDCVVFNLCTMYELSCDNEVTSRKKCVLQRVAKRFCLDDINELSFRITGS